MPPPSPPHPDATDPVAWASERLGSFLDDHRRVLVLTGAGCSTDAGIPDYRDRDGLWKRPEPMRYQVFVADAAARQRYWARSMAGWLGFANARPTTSHASLASLERAACIDSIVTQNVDGLHGLAGSREVIDLHGRLDRVTCLCCGAREARIAFQERLIGANPAWHDVEATAAPDGDADLDVTDFSGFRVPACQACGGILKPDVVFFGETVPADRIAAVMKRLESADAMLVVGSSLMVHSGYRYARWAAESGRPVAALNLGRTRADPLLTLKLDAPCAPVLAAVAAGVRRSQRLARRLAPTALGGSADANAHPS
ncbi:MAG: NAD-dependent protein deacetylase [Burkholderiaceae bacterium]|nr:NAD-dependent protein deacetylase [Burkholderiaceae bacterium]